MVDVHTREQHVFYVSRWLAVDEDDHQLVRELPVRRSPAADTLPGTTARPLTATLNSRTSVHRVTPHRVIKSTQIISTSYLLIVLLDRIACHAYMRPDVARSVVCLSVFLSVCWAQG